MSTFTTKSSGPTVYWGEVISALRYLRLGIVCVLELALECVLVFWEARYILLIGAGVLVGVGAIAVLDHVHWQLGGTAHLTNNSWIITTEAAGGALVSLVLVFVAGISSMKQSPRRWAIACVTVAVPLIEGGLMLLRFIANIT